MKQLLILPVLFSTCLCLSLRADTTLVFNEIMYHPATNEPAWEWIELRNQMAVDLDVSGWSVAGGIAYTFPSNTIVRGGGFLVLAISPTDLQAATGLTDVAGPFTGRLGNNGDTLQLRNNSGRLMDEVVYGVEGDWPVSADGSGASLAKYDRDSASGPAGNWRASEQVGGTPGADNFPFVNSVPPETQFIGIDAAWKYDDTGSDLGTAWREPGYNDLLWNARVAFTNRTVPGLFNTGVGDNGVALAAGSADPHYIITAAAQGSINVNATVMQNNAAWVANDNASMWIGVVSSGSANVNGGNYNYRTRFPLSGFLLSTVKLNLSVSVDDNLSNVLLNGVPTGLTAAGYASFTPSMTLSSGFVEGTNSLEFTTVNGGANPTGFRAVLSGSGLAMNTSQPLAAGRPTYYFRKAFVLAGDPAFTVLKMNPLVADGAVFYLNGVEVHRQNLPTGTIAYATPANTNVLRPNFSGMLTLPSASLVAGTNVLAVEVHQADGSADAAVLGTELIAQFLPTPSVTVAFNEFTAATNEVFWLELINYGIDALALDGYVIALDGATNGAYVLPPAILEPGQRLALTNTTLGFHPVSGDKLHLFSPARSAVLNSFVAVRRDRARWPEGTGSWLYPEPLTPGEANQFAFHHEIVINEIMYHHRLIPATNNIPARESPEAWIELFNRGTSTVDLTGWTLRGGVSFDFPPGLSLPAGGYLLVAEDAAYLRALYPSLTIAGQFSGRLSFRSDQLLLKDATGNPADEVRYYGEGRWPDYADGGGSSLELRDPNADNSAAEAWAASDETQKSAWQTYTYRAISSFPSGTQPTQWNDFILGLLGPGECLVDDISVIESPGPGGIQFIANGNFENGLTGWRVLGNHGGCRLETDPDNPGNHVLRIVATGPQEHMHNHVETTYVGGRTNTPGREYEISFRARWLAGNNLLNSRMYFNRCARTTALPVPPLNGTPGTVNSRLAANIGPTFRDLRHGPVVPQTNETVTVSVTAEDPQGVTACVLRWSANGGAWNNVAMSNQGNGRYRGVIPPYPAGTLVQFYVRAEDGLGAAATFPARGPDSGALYAVADGQADLKLGHNLRILLSPANRELLHAFTNVMSNDNLPGTVVVDEKQAYYDAGVRLKGSERGRYSDIRTSFHVEFPPDNLFRGVHPVMLIDRSGAGDSVNNKQLEIVIKHILLRAGHIPGVYSDLCRVIAPRSLHTGPAILSPRHEDDFIETAYENGGDGQLFELELIYYPTSTNAFGYKNPTPDSVLGPDIQDLGDDPELYRYNFIIKNHRDVDDYSRFMLMAKTFSLDGSALNEQTRLVMDVDEWLRAWALVTMCGVSDSYTFGNNHNLLMYLRPADRKFLAFPVDMDFSFVRAADAALIGDRNFSKIINLPGNLRRFYGHILDLISTSYSSTYMSYWVNHYNSFCPGQNFSSVPAYIQTRTTVALNAINSAGGNSAFALSGTNYLTAVSNLVTLSGTAPVTVRSIVINGIEQQVSWSSVSAWTLRLPVTPGTNQFVIQGYDLQGNPIASASNQVTVAYAGAVDAPEDSVVFNEIMVTPGMPDAEFIELHNRSAGTTFDLTGWRLNGVDYTFPAGSYLAPKGYLVLAKDYLPYNAAFGSFATVFDFFGGNLQSGGETLTLFRPGASTNEEVVVDRVRYENLTPWPTNTPVSGSALQLVDSRVDNARVSNWSDGSGWKFYTFTSTLGNLPASTFQFYLQYPGAAYLDDAWLCYGSVPGAGTNMLLNGNFEGPFLTTQGGPWRATGLASNSTVSTELSHSGTASLQLASSGFNWGGTIGNLSQPVSIAVRNTNITLSFWYLPTTNTATIITYLNSKYRPTNTATLQLASPGAPNSTAGMLPEYPPLWLNEVQPQNLSGPVDNLGEREPWMEIYNAGAAPASLGGLFLADNYTDLTQWAFPSNAVIDPGQCLVVWADAEPEESTELALHASFRLANGSGSVVLSRLVDGAPQIIDYLNYSDIATNWSYGSAPDGQPFYRQAMYHATAGDTNNPAPPPVGLFINEWMADNQRTLPDPADGQFEDWFEIFNPGTNAVSLEGFYLTDNLYDRNQYRIPAGYSVPPGGFLLVWADNESAQNRSNRLDLHVNFALNRAGESIGLFTPDGSLVDAVTFGSQTNDMSQGRYPDAAADVRVMTAPTPGAHNVVPVQNAAPALDYIGEKHVVLGQTLRFFVSATDSDQPPQQLSYSLEANPIYGASLDAISGEFVWTPGDSQWLGTNAFIIRVTDDGTPPLEDTQTLAVVVCPPPRLSLEFLPGGQLRLQFALMPGISYRLEYKNALTDEEWTPVSEPMIADGSLVSVTVDAAGQPQRFYRLLLLNSE